MIAGAALVLASTVLGGVAVAVADHTEGFWAVGRDVKAGDPVRRGDFVAVRAKVPARTASALFRTDRALPGRLDDLRWASDGRAGMLVTESTLATRRGVVEIPVVVAAGGVPGDLRAGDLIDVWSAPSSAADESGAATVGTARRLLQGVRVVGRSSSTGVAGGSGVTLVVDAAGSRVDGHLVGSLSAGRITIVRVS